MVAPLTVIVGLNIPIRGTPIVAGVDAVAVTLSDRLVGLVVLTFTLMFPLGVGTTVLIEVWLPSWGVTRYDE